MRLLQNSYMALICCGLLLTACGGGGGGTTTPAASTIKGTASAGAPIIGTVTIKDSSTPFKTKTVTIAADGKYTIDVSGLTAPFMMSANGTVGGTTYNLYSAATSADINGTINVTPLTDLIVANIAGQLASKFFAAGNFSTLTTAELDAQETALQARLQPILTAAGVGAAIDLLRASFATDHTGLDAALDVLRVTIDPTTAQATITNIISNQQITDDIASKIDTVIAIGATGVASGITDLQTIVAGFNTFTSLFATSPPANDNPTLNALFDNTFLLDGDDKVAFLSEITSDPTLIGLQLTNISLVPGSMLPVGAPTTARVTFDVVQGGSPRENIEFIVNKVGSVWKMSGNHHIAQARARSFARQDNGISIDTGLIFEIDKPTVAGLATLTTAPPVGAGYYAVVTGAGLPSGGLLYFDQGTGNSMDVAAGDKFTYIGTTTPRLFSYGHNQYPLSDAAIATLADNEIYTITFYHDNATPTSGQTGDDVPLMFYTSNAGKRPYLFSELSAASFAVITAPSKADLTAFANAGGTKTVTWTLPTTTLGAKSNSLHYWRSGTIGSDNTNVDLVSTATSGVLTMSSLLAVNAGSAPIGTLVANGINLAITDSYNRELTTIYNGQ